MKFERGDVCLREGITDRVYVVVRRRSKTSVYTYTYSVGGVWLSAANFAAEQFLYPAPSALIPDEVLRVSTMLKLGGEFSPTRLT